MHCSLPGVLATGKTPSINCGFSLIELLVVVLIIGLGISFVSTNLGGNSSYRLRVEAKQFANNVSMAAEEAVLSNQQWGVDIFRVDGAQEEQFGYRWLVRNDNGIWEVASDDTMDVEYLFSKGIGLRLQLDGLDEEQPIEFKQEIDQRKSVLEELSDDSDEKKLIDEQGLVEKKRIEPAIWLLSSGEINAFVLTVFDQENTDWNEPSGKIAIKGDELGRITVDTGAESDEES